MIPTVNDGSRPSKLQLDRYATGELSAEEAAAIEAQLDTQSQGHLDALVAAKTVLPALDVAALRSRADGMPGSPVVTRREQAPRASNLNRFFAPALLLLAAALALMFVMVPPNDTHTVGLRSGDALTIHQKQGQRLFDYAPGTPVGEGDTLGFRVNATGRSGVVLLSVDGSGTVSVFFPATGNDPEPLDGDGFVPLDGTVNLDGAPGPEVFVAVFDVSVTEAKTQVRSEFQSGGHAGLVSWASHAAGVDAVEVTRR